MAGIAMTQGHPAKTSNQPGQQSNLGQGLTNLEGNPINGNTTPGQFQIIVRRGIQATPRSLALEGPAKWRAQTPFE
jgi:hypothetical protein